MLEENLREKQNPSGLRIIFEPIPYLDSVTFGIFFKQGSRYESKELAGISHLIEHMLFKGTKKRSNKEIFRFLESKGGIGDGFTGKDLSGIYIRCPSNVYPALLELLREIVLEPSFPEKELIKEKMIISEEIRSAKEDPSERIFDLLFQAMFGDSPVGRPITGEEKSVNSISSKDLHDFYIKNYGTENSLLVVVGNFQEEFIGEEWTLQKGSNKSPTYSPQNNSRFLVEKKKDLTQVYAALGIETQGLCSEERYPLALLSIIMGGGMCSRLFQIMREEKAIAYTITSFLHLFEDIGILGIYFVTEKKKLDQALYTIYKEMEKIRKEGFEQQELEIAKNLVKSSILLDMESPTERMMRIGKGKLLQERLIPIPEVIKKYEKCEKEEIKGLFDKYFTKDSLNYAFIGPLKEKEVKKAIGS